MSRNSRKCEICANKEYGNPYKKQFFGAFPLDEGRCREWLKAVGNAELALLPIEKLHTNRHLCGDHFTKKDFNKKHSRLKRKAVPTLNLLRTPLTDEQLREFPKHMWNYKRVKTIQQSSDFSKNESITDTVRCTSPTITVKTIQQSSDFSKNESITDTVRCTSPTITVETIQESSNFSENDSVIVIISCASPTISDVSYRHKQPISDEIHSPAATTVEEHNYNSFTRHSKQPSRKDAPARMPLHNCPQMNSLQKKMKIMRTKIMRLRRALRLYKDRLANVEELLNNQRDNT